MTRVLIAAALMLAALTSTALAQHCNQRVIQQQHHVQAVVKQQIVHQAFVPQAVISYGHGHGYQQAIVLQQAYPPQYYTAGAQIAEEAQADRLARKVQLLVEQRLDAALGEIKREQQAAEQYRHPGVSLAQQKCATCHMTGSIKVSEGGAPVLFTGLGEWAGKPAQIEAAVKAMHEGRMPPGDKGPLSDSEFIVIQDYLTKQN